MDSKIFVQNIKKYCKLKGIKPTPACRDAGVSGSFISNVERGAMPSIDKVQMLATYLGVTTSDLLGEEKPASGEASGQNKEGGTIEGFSYLTPERQELVRQHIALLLTEQLKD